MASAQMRVLILAALAFAGLALEAGGAPAGGAVLRGAGEAAAAAPQPQPPTADLPAAEVPNRQRVALRRQSGDAAPQQPTADQPSEEVPTMARATLRHQGSAAAPQQPEAEQLARKPAVPRQNLLKHQAPEVTIEDVESSLMTELAGKATASRLRELEASLKPMYDALPKEESGHLGHQAVRYALHRLLLQRHGWFVVGLEPTDEALPPYLNKEWVAEYLQGLLEQRLGDRGLNLRETVALAATLEDLVREEASRRLDTVFGLLHVPAESRMTSDKAERVLETYMMMYLDGGNFTGDDKDMDFELTSFKLQYTDWEPAAAWMQEIKGQHANDASDGKLGRPELVSVVNQLGERFGSFNDGECRSLKRELTGMEGPRPGRVPLMDFYKKGLYSHWEFNEKVDYLRVLGALDESDPMHPSVIVPNYLGSRPNCLAASNLYAVCCRNECEDLMGHLERKIAAPAASPEQILSLVSGLASDTVNASRKLSDGLAQRLRGIAARHGGQVPLHGRLFAQWMHHAYPRECPYPHEGGVNPQTPDEWMQETGQEHSEAELREILDSVRSGGANLRTKPRPSEELPWTEAEVLLAKGPVPAAPAAADSAEPSPVPAVDPAEPAPQMVLAKALLSVVLLAILGLHKSGMLFAKAHGRKRMARNLDFADFDDLDDLKKPCKGASMWQRWMVLLSLAAVCIGLEAVGVLDRFSFGCFLVVGLLMNVALPLIMHGSSKPKKLLD